MTARPRHDAVKMKMDLRASSLRARSVDACVATIREGNADMRAVLNVVATPLRDPDAPDSGILFDVPYVLKDTWDTAGIVTTGGSWRHRARVPDESSVVFTTFQKAGAVLLGKSNLCDLAFSPESDNHLIGATRNPLDRDRTSGGSTGGGAAAIGAGMAAFDWGSDFAGSVRMPAAFCGVVGLRLSSETWPIPMEGFFPQTPSFDVELHGMGPLARTVEGVRSVVRAAERLRKRGAHGGKKMCGVRLYAPDAACVGAWPTFVGDAARALLSIDERFEVDRTLPSSCFVNDAYNGYVCANFGAFLAVGELPLGEALSAIVLGLVSNGRLDRRIHPNTGMLLLALAAGRLTVYGNAARARDRVRRVEDAMRAIWEKGHLVVAPTATSPAPRHGRAAFDHRLLAFAKLGNLTDATAIALPFGHFEDGLPRSLQILGPPGSEDAVLDLAARLEARRPEGQSNARE